MCNPMSLRLTSPQEMTRAEWTAGAVGTVLVISGIALAILALVRPDLLTHAVGTIVKDPLLIAYCGAGASILGGAVFMAMAVIRKNQAIEADESRPADKPNVVETYPENVRRFYELDPIEPDFVKTSLHGKITLSALFEDEGALLENVADYPGELPSTGQVDPNLMTQSVMKGKIEGTSWLRFIAFKMVCLSSEQKIKQAFPDRPINLTEPSYMILFRDKPRWVQRWTCKVGAVTPSFLIEQGKGANWAEGACETEGQVLLEEHGFNNLKLLMKGHASAFDNNGLEWKLA